MKCSCPPGRLSQKSNLDFSGSNFRAAVVRLDGGGGADAAEGVEGEEVRGGADEENEGEHAEAEAAVLLIAPSHGEALTVQAGGPLSSGDSVLSLASSTQSSKPGKSRLSNTALAI